MKGKEKRQDGNSQSRVAFRLLREALAEGEDQLAAVQREVFSQLRQLASSYCL